MTGCDGVVFFGQVDWWYHNRGHSSCRIATRIAAKRTTLWVNSVGMRMPRPGRTEIALRRYLRKLRSLTRGLRRDPATGMWIYTPLFVPRYTPRFLELNGWLVALQVRILCRLLRMRRPSAWVSLPSFAPLVERIRWHRVVVDRCDDFSSVPEADTAVVAGLEQRLFESGDVAAYASADLMEREASAAAEARLLEHGVDFQLFASARPLAGKPPEIPEALRDLPRPLVGFFGALDDYRMDLELLVRIARHVAPGTLLLVGPRQMDLSRLEREPNVVLVGQVAPEVLPTYAAPFDVGVIPFLQNEFNASCSPIKLKEYLALAFPIVATRLPAFEPYGDLIEQADSHDEFLAAIDRGLAEPASDGRAARRRRAVAGDSWETIAERACGMLGVEVA